MKMRLFRHIAILGAMTAAERVMGRYMRAPDHEPGSAAEMALKIKKDFNDAHDKVKEIAEKALAESEKGVTLSNSVKEKADEALIKMNGLQEQVAQIEQQLARGNPGGDDAQQKSLGEQFVEDEHVKSFISASPTSGNIDLRVKATITSATTNTDGSAGAGVAVTRLPGVQELPQRRMTIRGLISPGRMDGNALEYVRETGFVNNAAVVAEGDEKPGSDLKFDLVSTSAKVIAHWMKASRQILDDFSQLRSIIDQRLLYGLAFAEERQLLNGDGSGQNLKGILPQATMYKAAIALTAPTKIDIMRLSMLQAALAEFPATGHVLNPIDWTEIELTKDADGHYIIGNPQGTTAPTLWGLPVVTTQAMAVDNFLTGAFQLGAQLFDRWDSRVELGYVDKDFTKNLVTILAEERIALAVTRPEAFVKGKFKSPA